MASNAGDTGAVVAMDAHLVLRPFTASEQKSSFENQPVCRPVLEVSASGVKLLDPAVKFKVKREFPLTGHVHWFPADGDASGSEVEPATIKSTVGPAASQMAKNLFEGFNATTVVIGHAKSGKATVLLGDAGQPAKDDEKVTEGPISLPDTAGLLPRFCSELFTAFEGKPDNCTMTVTVECVGFDDAHGITDMVSAKKAASTSTAKHTDPEPLKVREEANGPAVSGTQKMSVRSAASMLDAIQHGYSRYRKFKARASTHLVFIVRCEETLTFADPKAPSENITKKGHAVAMFALVVGRPTAFFRCADNAFQRDSGENEKAKVPFREASLTRLLQDFFGSNTNPYAFSCVGPHHTTSKDAIVVLDMAKKLEAVKAKPRITYDETTSEFRKLDEEVNTLSSELSAAKDAHEIIQEELSARQQALDESRATFREQDSALVELKDQKASEEILVAVRKFRLARQQAIDQAEEEALGNEIEDGEAKLEDLDQEVSTLEATAVAASAAYASAVVVSEGLQARESAASASIKRNEQRYSEVEASKDGLGALKVQVESDHQERVANKAPEAATMREDAAALKKETDDMVKPTKIAQMASDSLASLRKRVQAAKDRKAALDKEAQDLPKEIDSLEKEVEQMEKDAAPEPSCCVVM